MKFFGTEKRGGFLKVETKDYTLKSLVEKTPYGWKVSGVVKGKPGRIEIFKKDAPEKILINNWQSWEFVKK